MSNFQELIGRASLKTIVIPKAVNGARVLFSARSRLEGPCVAHASCNYDWVQLQFAFQILAITAILAIQTNIFG
jgi:hypothetical protein